MSQPDEALDLNALTQSMVAFSDATRVISDWATGYRASLGRDGWSETQAERIAADALIEVFRKAMRG